MTGPGRIIARGPRPSCAMERVTPVVDGETDPIRDAIERRDAGDAEGAQEILGKVLEADLRCLDAHSLLGNLHFRLTPAWALPHYEVGVRIGELSLGSEFDGVLPWGYHGNRPFLSCLHSYGLCLWRLERWDEAARVFERLLWTNPSDNQGVRAILPRVRARHAWEERAD